MRGTAPLKISAVLFQEEDGAWSGQCLEYDIAAQAKTLHDLRYELQRILIGHLVASAELGQEPFMGLEPAPRRFWEMYEQADVPIPSRQAPFRLPHPAMIPPLVQDFRISA